MTGAVPAFNTLLQPWAFVDDATILMKSGALAVLWRVGGVDYEGLDHPARQQVVHRFLASLKPIDERFRLTQYLVKRRIPPFVAAPCAHPVAAEAFRRRVDDLNGRDRPLYAFDLYMALLVHGPAQKAFATRGRRATIQLEETELHERLTRLHRTAHAFETAIGDVLRPVRLGRQESYAFLEQLLNVDPQTLGMPLKTDRHLDYFLPHSPVTYHPDHIRLGTQTVKILTMRALPGQTYAHLLQDLDHTPGEWIACLDAQRVDRGALQLWIREGYYNLASVAMPTSAAASKAQLEDVRKTLEHDGRTFWHVSLTLMVHDRDPRIVEEAVAGAIKTFAAHDGLFVEEAVTINAPWAWLAIVPGNHAFNSRAELLPMTDENLGDLSFLFRLDRGEERSAYLQAPALAVFETETETPYYYNLHVEDVGHTLIVGSTGGGKSFLARHLFLHLQQYDPAAVIFDVGHGYRKIVEALGGGYLELGLHTPTVTLNPFAMEPSATHLHFVASFVKVLLEGRAATPLTEAEDRDVFEQVEAVYAYPRAQRRLSTLLLSKPLQRRLNVWLEGGRFPLFDHVDDTLTIQRLQAFDLAAMAKYPEVLEPLLFYVLHRIPTHPALVGAGILTIWMDEAWLQIQHPAICKLARRVMKTGRKDNIAIVLITQSLKDFESSGLLPDVLQNFHTTFVLADPSFAVYRQQYATLLQLNAHELDLVERLQPKKQLFLKRPGVAKVLNLVVDETSAALYTPDATQDVLV